MKKASANDVPQLVALMAEFYAESPYALNRQRATEAFDALLADERLGHVWFIQAESRNVGYVVLTLCFSMEFGGLVALVDDFFVRSAFRNIGLGTAALLEVRNFCGKQGIRALHVETHAAALGVYRRVGFVDQDRLHRTLKLADPIHMD